LKNENVKKTKGRRLESPNATATLKWSRVTHAQSTTSFGLMPNLIQDHAAQSATIHCVKVVALSGVPAIMKVGVKASFEFSSLISISIL